MLLLAFDGFSLNRSCLWIPDSVDGIITANEDLKLETKADANSEMDETMKPKLNVELNEDTGQGSMDNAVNTACNPRAILMILGFRLVQDLTYRLKHVSPESILTFDKLRSVDP